MLGYLNRNFFLAPSWVKLIMYKPLIHLKLEYAAAVLDPTHSSLITLIEPIQKVSACYILRNNHHTARVSIMKTLDVCRY